MAYSIVVCSAIGTDCEENNFSVDYGPLPINGRAFVTPVLALSECATLLHRYIETLHHGERSCPLIKLSVYLFSKTTHHILMGFTLKVVLVVWSILVGPYLSSTLFK
jgi:hypothetical protein